ncbi:hypothetical protein ACFOY5_10500 [Massilia aurea]|uniref:hypothetical protein n=1 Tax=Massilia aurea TaxID=373040 RepID=UPI0021623737|nr:hypothetical protein [Massilia aurea]MCS0709512.1 hypothetical protein [Massilia aurea]
MRSSDEHQANPTQPHLRPDLMSSARHGGNEDSILARLEREPARRTAPGGTGVRVAWYGGAVLVALGLTGALAWLAAGQDSPHRVEPAHAAMAARAIVADEPAAPLAAAVIVDAAPALAPVAAPVTTPAPAVSTAHVLQPPVPPLRLLRPADGVRVPVKPTRTAAAPERSAAKSVVPVPAPLQARANVPRQAARPTKHAGPARVTETPDSDVALISAVIYHANGHALPDPEMNPDRCAGDACRPRPTR